MLGGVHAYRRKAGLTIPRHVDGRSFPVSCCCLLLLISDSDLIGTQTMNYTTSTNTYLANRQPIEQPEQGSRTRRTVLTDGACLLIPPLSAPDVAGHMPTDKQVNPNTREDFERVCLLIAEYIISSKKWQQKTPGNKYRGLSVRLVSY